MHFIADQLRTRGDTAFFSLGYSYLSKLKADPRSLLWSKSNIVEHFDGVQCYLFRTRLHPFNLKKFRVPILAKMAFNAYAASMPAIFNDWVKNARTIIIESGVAVSILKTVKKINPSSYLIYIASDALDTIDCDPYLTELLCDMTPYLDRIIVPSRLLAHNFPDLASVRYVPHGIESERFEMSIASPYLGGTNVISVGSMLFDSRFFEIACAKRPDLKFHIIGGGHKSKKLSAANLTVYDEMSFEKTIAYIKYADVGVAPYIGERVTPYLADTSMKLMQYGFFGVPAICPWLAAGDHFGRFGYDPMSSESILNSINKALTHGRFPGLKYKTWFQVTDAILDMDG